MKKISFSHKALQFRNPITGEYDENEQINEDGVIFCNATMVVCPCCDGHGTHFPKHLDDSRMVEMMEEDGDEDGLESYYNGGYDVACEECGGNNVVASPQLPEWASKLIHEWNREEAEYRRYSDMERRMGA